MKFTLYTYIAAAAMALCLAGCGGAASEAAPPAPTAAATVTAEPTPEAAATPTPSPTAAPTAAPAATPTATPVQFELRGAGSVTAGKGIQLCPVGADGQDIATDAVDWTSSDESVAIVTNGWIDARKAGTVTITATAADGGSAGKEITVQARPVVQQTPAGSQGGGTASAPAAPTEQAPAPAPDVPQAPADTAPAPDQPASEQPAPEQPGSDGSNHHTSPIIEIDPNAGHDVTLD